MSALVWLRLAHVVLAVLGAGNVAAVAVAARAAAKGGATATLGPLVRWASIGFGATFLTGAALDLATGGAYHEHWWFRLSGLSMLAAGALLGVFRRRVGRAATEADPTSTLASARWLAYGAAALVLCITVLMELRPFG